MNKLPSFVLVLASCSSSGKTPTRVGELVAYSTQFTSQGQPVVSAGVYVNLYDPLAGCTVMGSGSCRIAACPIPLPDPPATPAAGTLSFTGMRDAITLDPPSYLYDTPGVVRTQFGAGASIGMKGSGGADVPAFALTVLGPGSPKYTGPDPDGAGHVHLPMNAPLTVTWTDATIGEVVVHLEQDVDTTHHEVECRFVGTAGTGTVTSLAPFTPGASGRMEVRGETRTTADAGDFRLTGRAFAMAQEASGEQASFVADFE
ncbi:MAG TPA: hypothetical protein VF316_11465 [Polyangiaceae bacterium]